MPDATDRLPGAGPSSASDADVVLRVEGLRKFYGANEVVRGLSFEIRRGECFGLLGPNGAGKTTTLRCCLGLIDPDGGTIEMVGERVPEAARKARFRVGVVPQQDNLDPDFTVTENLQVYGRYFGLDRVTLAARIPKLLEFAGLASRGDAALRTLSGGMKRRLTLARALVNDPELLILDEPTTGLDPQFRHDLWQRLLDLRARGITILLTTHYMEEAERLCDRLVIMDQGKIVATGAPEELIRSTVPPGAVEVRATPEERVRIAAGLAARFGAPEEYSDRLVYYTADGDQVLAAIRAGGYTVGSEIVRRSTLEDVFLRLTGRELSP